MAISKEEFRAALAKFPSGVTVVTLKDAEGRRHGITVSAFCSVSLEPPLILVCIDRHTASHYAFAESGRFAVNILGETAAAHSNHFATPLTDKFDDIAHLEGIGGIPLLADALVHLECRLVHDYDGGDHTIFVGEIEKANITDGNPLVYFAGKYQRIIE